MADLHWFVVFGLLHLAVPDHDVCTKIQAMNPGITAVECWASDQDYDKPNKVATQSGELHEGGGLKSSPKSDPVFRALPGPVFHDDNTWEIR